MRTDKQQLHHSIRSARSWENSRYLAEVLGEFGDASVNTTLDGHTTDQGLPLQGKIRLPFSGNERNRLFFNDKAKQFLDLSGISGLDNPADGRVFALWDFDRDGWQDVALANSSAPLLNIYRNEIGTRAGSVRDAGQIIAVRFVGGSHSDQPNTKYGCRDGYGAKVLVTAGDLELIREHRCGDGMAAQNSATMIVGIGHNDVAQTVAIRWPSGAEQQIDNVPAGTLLTVYENPSQSPNGTAFVRESYVIPSSRRWDVVSRPNTARFQIEDLGLDPGSVAIKEPKALLFTTMATWCAACKQHLPQLRQLREKLGPELVQMYGIPIDEADDRDKLAAYAEQHQPAYRLLAELTNEQRNEAKQFVSDSLNADALPSTIVTDVRGDVLLVTTGLPTVSQLLELLSKRSAMP